MQHDSLTLKNEYQKGLSTLEMLIAMTLIVISISATLPLVAGSQSASVDLQTNQEALYKAEAILEEARAKAVSDYNSVITTSLQSDGIYQKQTYVIPASVTQCGKDVKASVAWTTDNRPLGVELTTHFGDTATAQALGGNCDTTPPSFLGWNPPDTWASSDFDSGNPNPTGLDVLNGIVYMTADGNPNSAKNFYIADTNGIAKGTSSGLFATFANNFEAGEKLNDLKVARLSDGKIYAFVARDTKTGQFQVIDVSDIYNPVS
ncbi:MAG: type II secretion system protein, partial [bacterium]|nr:type II secretion system protein [bacterium]